MAGVTEELKFQLNLNLNSHLCLEVALLNTGLTVGSVTHVHDDT